MFATFAPMILWFAHTIAAFAPMIAAFALGIFSKTHQSSLTLKGGSTSLMVKRDGVILEKNSLRLMEDW